MVTWGEGQNPVRAWLVQASPRFTSSCRACQASAEAPPVPLGPVPRLTPADLRIAVLESNPLVQVSADTAAVVQATARLLAKAGARVKRAAPKDLAWRQSWDDWIDLFQYQNRALEPLAERQPFFGADGGSDPSARSMVRTARL